MTRIRRDVRQGEALAMMPENIRSDMHAQWWDLFQIVPENKRYGSVEVVSIRGSLDHHSDFGCDSYEAIKCRVAAALEGEHRGEEDEAFPPKYVVLRIDSPGGVVAGLNETVFALRDMAKKAGIPLVAYVDEMSASAAYALACACEEIVLPPAAIVGSVGVISMMCEQTEMDKEMGLKYVTITSGERKADGHPHVPITNAAIAIEQKRVNKYAKQFYRLVADVRDLSTKEIASYEAGIFVGNEAVTNGLADAVMKWNAFLAYLENDRVAKKSLAKVQPNGSRSTLQPTYQLVGNEEKMTKALFTLIERTKAQLTGEKDEAKRASLSALITSTEATVEAYKKARKSEEDDEEDEEEEEEEAKKAKKAKSKKASEAKGNETDRKEGKKPDDKDDEGDDDEEDDDDAKKAKAVAKAVVSGDRRELGRLTALISKAQKFDALSSRMDKIEADANTKSKNAAIDEAVAQRRITKHMATQLRTKDLAFVTGTLELHAKAMVNIDDDALKAPDGTPHADLPAIVRKDIENAVAAINHSDPTKAEAFRQKLITEHRERMAHTNGAGGQY